MLGQMLSFRCTDAGYGITIISTKYQGKKSHYISIKKVFSSAQKLLSQFFKK